MLSKFIRSNPKNPVLLTVPHSGDYYPDIFIKNLKLNLNKIRKIEDFHSDKILNFMNLNSADIIIAKCSRVVVDLNRSRNAIDEDMFIDKVSNCQIEEKKNDLIWPRCFPKNYFQ